MLACLSWVECPPPSRRSPRILLSRHRQQRVDYVSITNTVIIPTVITNDANYRIPVRGIAGAFAATNKGVTVTLVSGTNYQISTVQRIRSTPTRLPLRYPTTAPIDASKRITGAPLTATDFSFAGCAVEFPDRHSRSMHQRR